MSDEPKNIHEAILAIYKQVGYVQKQRAAGLNYSYAGEAALIEAVRPWMAEYGVIMYVSELSEFVQTPYETKSGTPMMNITMAGKVVFLHTPSQTFIEVASRGEGSDSGDKASNKALTGMYKYAIRQTFMIETDDDPDKTPSEQMERSGKNGKSNTAVVPSVKELVNYAMTKWHGEDRDAVKTELGKVIPAAGLPLPPDPARWGEYLAAVDKAVA